MTGTDTRALVTDDGGSSAEVVLGALRTEVRDLTGRWRAEGRYTPRSDSWLRSFDPAFSRELAARHLLGITWPRRFGGRAGSNVMRLAVTEELLRAGAPVAAHWVADRQIGPAILRHGSERLQAEILPGITAGRYLFCLGMSEPGAGSDLAAVRTFATQADGGWRVSGRKVWTSLAQHATHMYLLARTERRERKHEGLTEFIADMDSPGITVSPIIDLTGEHHFNEVLLEDVFIPGHRVLGRPGAGWGQVVEQLSFERGGPERVLSTYPLLMSLLAEVPGTTDPEPVRKIGTLAARLAVMRRMCADVAREPRDSVHLDRAAADALRRAPSPVLVRARLGVLWSAAIAGALSRAHELTRGYVREREQFGRPLVAIPAVASSLALMRVHVLQTQAGLARAVECWHTPAPDPERCANAAAVARITAATAATDVARLAHQLHGAMGITAEYPLHRLTRRLWAWRDTETAEHEWARRLGAATIAGGEPALWTEISA